MEISLFLAKVIGLYLLIAGVGILFNYQRFQPIIKAFMADSPLVLITSVFTVILGIMLVIVHNVWVCDWRVVITLISWLTLIKGILWLCFPNYAIQLTIKWNNPSVFMASALFSFLVGLFLLYHGFYMAG